MDIVVGYVDNAAGNAALRLGLAEAALRGASIRVRHVVRVGSHNEPPSSVERMRGRLEQITGQIASEGLDGDAELLFERGEPADAILDEVVRLRADLLVIGSRRRSRVGKLLLGSTSQQVVLRAPCAVLSVNPGAP